MPEKFSITGEINVTPPSNLRQIANQIKKELSTPILLNLDVKQSANQLAKDVRDAFKRYSIPINLLPIQSAANIAKDIQRHLNSTSFSLKIKVANVKQIGDDIANYLKGRTIPVNIQVNQTSVSAATKSLNTVTTSANESADAMENLAKQTALTIRRFGVYTVATAAFYKLSRSIREGIDEAIKFDEQFIRIRQVTKQSTNSLSELTREVGKLSSGLGVSSQELLNASQVLAQAGFSTREVTQALETLALTDLSPTFDSINQGAEGAIALLNQFGLSIDELQPKFGAINAVSAKFAVESSDLITGIQTAGGAFAAAGGDVEQLLGLFTSVRQTTRASASGIAVGLKTISTRLQRGRTQSFLKDLGIDLKFVGEEARQLGKEGLFVGVYEAIRRISTALKSIPKNDPRFAQIAEELGGFRQIDKVIPLLTEFELAERARGVAIRDTDSLTKDSIIAQESLSNQFAKVREQFNLLIRDIANSDSLRTAVSQFLNLASAAIRLTETLEKLAVPLTLIAGLRLAKTTGVLGSLVVKNLSGGQNKLPIFNTGGPVPGIGNKDTIQAMLTPGEYVLNKKASKKLGKKRLDVLNQGNLPAFNTGGAVGRITSNPGTVAGGIILAPLLANLSELNGATKNLIIGLSGAAIQVVALNSFLKPSNDSIKQFNESVKKATQPLLKQANIDKALDKRAQANLNSTRARFNRSPNIRNNIRFQASELIANQTSANRKLSEENLRIQREINERKKEEIRLNSRLTTGLSILTGSLVVASTFFDKLAVDGLEAIRSGDRSNIDSARRNTLLGSAAGGAATGIGGTLLANASLPMVGIAAFSGPLLVAGAAVAGLAYGAYSAVTALEEFDKEVRLIDINKVSSDLSKALQSVSSGRSSVFLQRNNVIGNLSDLRGRLATEADPQNREDVNSAIDGSLDGLQQFIDATTSSSVSLKQFSNVIPTDVLEFFARRTGQSLDDLTESIQANIEANVTYNKRFEESLLNLQAFEIRLRAEVALSNAIQQSVSGLSELNNTFNNISSGNITTNTSSRLSDRLGSLGSIADIPSFEKDLNKFTSFFGTSLESVGKDSIDAANAIKLLPNILLDLRNSDPLSGSGDIVDNLNDTLRKAGLGNAIRESIVNQISKFGEGGKGDAGIVDALSKNLTGILESVSGELSSVGSSLKEANIKVNDELSIYAQGLETSNRAVIEARNRTSSSFDIRRNAIRTVSEKPNLQAEQNVLNNQQNFVTEGRNSQQILNDLINSQKTLVSLNEQLANTTDIQERKNIIVAQREQALRIQKANQALTFLSDAATRASVLESQLNKEREARQTRRGIAERITFSTAEERVGINRSLGFTRLAASAGTIDVVPENLRNEVLSFLKEVGDATLGGLGGKSGNEILDQLVASSLKSAGINQQGIIAPSQQEANISGQMEKIFADSEKIQRELAKLEIDNLNIFVSNLDTSFQTFLSELKTTILSEQVASADQEIKSIIGNLGQTQRLQGSGQALQNLSGVDADTLRSNFEAIIKEFDNFQLLVNKQNKINSLKNESLGSFTGSEAVIRGLLTDNKGIAARSNEEGESEVRNVLLGLRKRLGDEIGKQLEIGIFEEGGLTKIQSGFGKNSPNKIVDTFTDILNNITNDLSKASESTNKNLDQLSLNVGGDKILSTIKSNRDDIVKIISTLPELVNFSDLENQIKNLETQLKIANQRRAALGFNTGGIVPGSGSTDTVPAMLTPGEVVINKQAVQRIGANKLLKLNNPVQNFNQGGLVQSIDQSSLGIFNTSINTFMNGINTIAQALSNIPSKIEMTGNHRVEVVINGSQVLNNIMPEISSLVKGEIKRSINRLITERFPEQGPF